MRTDELHELIKCKKNIGELYEATKESLRYLDVRGIVQCRTFARFDYANRSRYYDVYPLFHNECTPMEKCHSPGAPSVNFSENFTQYNFDSPNPNHNAKQFSFESLVPQNSKDTWQIGGCAERTGFVEKIA